MKDKFIFIIIFIFLTSLAYSQTNNDNEINKVDSNGLKQGIWIKKISSNVIDSMNYLNGKLHGQYKSYFIKTGDLRYSGDYNNGSITGIWTNYNKGIIVAKEIDRGINQDSVTNEQGLRILPPFFSYVKFYDHDQGYLKSEGKILHFDSWEMDYSNEHGLWIYYDFISDTIKTRIYNFGKILEENAP